MIEVEELRIEVTSEDAERIVREYIEAMYKAKGYALTRSDTADIWPSITYFGRKTTDKDRDDHEES